MPVRGLFETHLTVTDHHVRWGVAGRTRPVVAVTSTADRPAGPCPDQFLIGSWRARERVEPVEDPGWVRDPLLQDFHAPVPVEEAML